VLKLEKNAGERVTVDLNELGEPNSSSLSDNEEEKEKYPNAKDSVYYDPTFNPYGAPPPGMPQRFVSPNSRPVPSGGAAESDVPGPPPEDIPAPPLDLSGQDDADDIPKPPPLPPPTEEETVVPRPPGPPPTDTEEKIVRPLQPYQPPWAFSFPLPQGLFGFRGVPPLQQHLNPHQQQQFPMLLFQTLSNMSQLLVPHGRTQLTMLQSRN